MPQSMELFLDNEPVRFTPEGRMFVLDAIAAVTQTNSTAEVWSDFKQQKPEVNQYVDTLSGDAGDKEPVCGSDGWDAIQDLLFDYIIYQEINKA